MGVIIGTVVGSVLGCKVGDVEGNSVGASVGVTLGWDDDRGVGVRLGTCVGCALGGCVTAYELASIASRTIPTALETQAALCGFNFLPGI